MAQRIFRTGPDGSTSIEPCAVDPVEENTESKSTQESSNSSNSKNIEREALAEMSFSTHIFSLNETARFYMGLLTDPEVGQVEPDFEAARHIIDTLVMLKVKTKGNLTEAESKLLNTIIYDLQVEYARLC